MNAEILARVLTRVAQGRKLWLAITITCEGRMFDATVVAVHQSKTIARFGNRRRRTLAEVKDAICHYFNVEFQISLAKQRQIESEIERLDEKARKKAIREKEPASFGLR